MLTKEQIRKQFAKELDDPITAVEAAVLGIRPGDCDDVDELLRIQQLGYEHGKAGVPCDEETAGDIEHVAVVVLHDNPDGLRRLYDAAAREGRTDARRMARVVTA